MRKDRQKPFGARRDERKWTIKSGQNDEEKQESGELIFSGFLKDFSAVVPERKKNPESERDSECFVIKKAEEDRRAAKKIKEGIFGNQRIGKKNEKEK